MSSTTVERATLGLHSLEQYAPLIGVPATERIFNKAALVRGMHVVHIS